MIPVRTKVTRVVGVFRSIGRSVIAGVVVTLLALLVSSKLHTPQKRPRGAPATSPERGTGAKAPDTPQRERSVAHAMLTGRVTSRRGGAAVGAARICAARGGAEPGATVPICVQSDVAGRYVLADLASGGYVITAEARGFLPGSAAGGRPVVVANGEATTGLDIVLDEGGVEIAGRVLDATGGVVAGAIVRATRTAPPLQVVAVPSGEDGGFVLSVAPGAAVVTAEAIGYAKARAQVVAPSAHLTMVLTPGATIEGTTVAALDGSPVGRIEVHAVPVGGWASAEHRSGTSRDDGAFSIGGVDPGAYALVAEGDGWRGESSAPLRVGLAEAVRGEVLRVSRVASVSGRVVMGGGAGPCTQGAVALGPTAPVQVSPYDPPTALPETTVSMVPSMMAAIGPAGDVQFRSVPAGRYHASIQCAESVLSEGPTTIEVASRDVEGIVWKVGPGLALRVHVVDDAEQPLAFARVLVLWPVRPLAGGPGGPGGPRPAMPLTADADGQADLPGVLYPGLYTLQGADGHPGAAVDVELREGSGRTESTLHLARSGGIVATVVAGTGGERGEVDDVTVRATPLGDADAGPALPVTGVALGAGRFRV
ncbi:MAG: carboxypeptidase regulatory-like domain-containing protein, partial [Polyangiaceae bacterium]